MNYSPLRLGIGNQVENATITATPEPLTPVDYLKNEFHARQLVFNGLTSDDIVIEGTLDAPDYATFFCIPGSNLSSSASVKLELFETDVSTTDLLGMGFVSIEALKPLGIWEVGIDPYNQSGETTEDNTFIHWFGSLIQYQRWRLTIQHGLDIPESPPSNGIPVQDASTGIVAWEAEDMTVNDVAGDAWSEGIDGGASGGAVMTRDGSFYSNPSAGPSLSQVFTAVQSGLHDLYFAFDPQSGGNSFYSRFDGKAKMKIVDAGDSMKFYLAQQVTLTAGQNHTVEFCARDYKSHFDKFQIQPAGTAAPTGYGATNSSEGTEGSDLSVSIRALVIGRDLKIRNNFQYGALMTYMTEPELRYSRSGHALPMRDQHQVRGASLRFPMADDADKFTFIELERQLKGRPFVVSIYPDHNDYMRQLHSFYARLASRQEHTHVFDDVHSLQLDLAEA